jgi:REP element-mobilizing transposase RayT
MSYYERRLPHWHPEHAAVFLTWRLHGSLPRDAVKLTESSPGQVFAATDRALAAATTLPFWLKDDRIAQCVVDAFHFGERQLHLYTLRCWVVMPNHVHMLVEPKQPVPKITHSIKTFTARTANEMLGRTGEPFWQDESFDRWVRDRQEFEKIAAYIEYNPVAAGLVKRVEEWRWSSAYAGGKD